MLIKDFYKVLSLTQEGNQIQAQIFVNKDHAIFKGHFPGNPVMPGVCIMQIIKELTEQVVGGELFMSKASNIKFKTIINPELHPTLDLQINIKEEEDFIKIKNTTKFAETVALQLSATYKKV